jgi:phenylalanyl-tRNA synthetase beta chain
MLHPAVSRQLSISQPAYLFQLNLEQITAETSLKYTKISKYPSIKRDISIVIDDLVTAAELLETIKLSATEALINLELFDVYRGEGIDSGKKSLALGLTFQRSSSTLTDEVADVAISDILQSLHKQYGAILRE